MGKVVKESPRNHSDETCWRQLRIKVAQDVAIEQQNCMVGGHPERETEDERSEEEVHGCKGSTKTCWRQ